MGGGDRIHFFIPFEEMISSLSCSKFAGLPFSTYISGKSENKITIISSPNLLCSRKTSRTFAFDHCFDAATDNECHAQDNDGDENGNSNGGGGRGGGGQDSVFAQLGLDLLENAFDGYNACIFAYGQTGSGKSYTMLGAPSPPAARGIIPRLCGALFQGIRRRVTEAEEAAAPGAAPSWQAKVEVSYMEIYNEKVHDLLDPNTSR